MLRMSWLSSPSAKRSAEAALHLASQVLPSKPPKIVVTIGEQAKRSDWARMELALKDRLPHDVHAHEYEHDCSAHANPTEARRQEGQQPDSTLLAATMPEHEKSQTNARAH